MNERRGMGVLAVIPARGGSKGVPRKNVRLLCGKPLIVYSLEQARESRRLDHFVVSTDDQEIAAVARAWGADVLIRPEALALDETPMVPVVEDVLARLDPGRERFGVLTLLQPTCPLRSPADIDSSIELLMTCAADAVVGVCRVWHEHPALMYSLNDEWLQPLHAELATLNRQDLPPLYLRNGVIYTVRRSAFEQEHTFWPKRSMPCIMTRERSLNIDEPLDWLLAERLMSHE